MMSKIYETNVPTFESMVPEIVHVKDTELFPPLACNEVYVGNGVEGCNYFVPSRWATPFAYGMDSGKAKFSRAQFKRYALTRRDREEWLRPLFGKRLICSCQSKHCHTGELIDLVSEELQAQLEEQQTCEDDELPDLVSDEDTEVDWDSPEASRETMWAANETLGTKVPEVSQKPGWPNAWHLLLAQIRLSTTLLFWEIFAGCAELTSQFERTGWSCATPIDFLVDPSFDVFHPEFLMLLLGILFEHRILLLHLGTPCSSFSMAFNRFISHAIRSKECPGGFPGLPKHKQAMVDVGNLLVHIGVALAKAQQAVGHLWTWEQPQSSLQLLYKPLADFLASHAVVQAISHICAYGAP